MLRETFDECLYVRIGIMLPMELSVKDLVKKTDQTERNKMRAKIVQNGNEKSDKPILHFFETLLKKNMILFGEGSVFLKLNIT